MVAGIPGSGLGGIFYMVLAAFMPLRELGATLRNRSSLKRWSTVLTVIALCAGILGALWAEAWVLTKVARRMQVSKPSMGLVVPALVATPFVVLGLLYAIVHAARFAIRLSRRGRRGRLSPSLSPAEMEPHSVLRRAS